MPTVRGNRLFALKKNKKNKKGYSKNYDTACEADMEGNEWSILHYGAVVCEAAGCMCAILGHNITVKNATKPK